MSINLPLPLLAEMAIFVRVVETGSFSAAADALGVSKGMLSRHVSSLESTLNAQLLQRTTRRLSLTEAGRTLYQQAGEIFAPAVALKVDPDAPAGDDPYADPQYQVPDDLVW